jgi:hypothetical protein
VRRFLPLFVNPLSGDASIKQASIKQATIGNLRCIFFFSRQFFVMLKNHNNPEDDGNPELYDAH